MPPPLELNLIDLMSDSTVAQCYFGFSRRWTEPQALQQLDFTLMCLWKAWYLALRAYCVL